MWFGECVIDYDMKGKLRCIKIDLALMDDPKRSMLNLNYEYIINHRELDRSNISSLYLEIRKTWKVNSTISYSLMGRTDGLIQQINVIENLNLLHLLLLLNQERRIRKSLWKSPLCLINLEQMAFAVLVLNMCITLTLLLVMKHKMQIFIYWRKKKWGSVNKQMTRDQYHAHVT